jgi:hypothetical protein
MPKLTVEGVGTFEVPQGKRLVNALEDEAKVDQLHSCVAISLPGDRCETACCDAPRQAPEGVSREP